MSGPKQPLRLEDIPFMNFGKYMINTMKGFGDQIAVKDGFTEKSYTYSDVINRSERIASGLQRLGIKPGDVVCILAPNHIECLNIFYGTTLINAVLQPLNPLFLKDDLTKVLKECDTKIVITVPELVPKVKEATVSLGKIKIVVLGIASGAVPFDMVLAPKDVRYRTPEADWKTSTAVMLYSSGTTGFPKAVKMSHYAIVANIEQMNWAETFLFGETLVSFVPMFHISGLFGGCCANARACLNVLMSRFDMEDYMRLIQIYKPESMPLVPPLMIVLAKHPRVSQYDLSSVKRIMCGGAPLSPEIEEAAKKRLNNPLVQQAYGMTEIGVTHAHSRDDSYRRNSVGKCVPLVDLKIVDVDSGQTLGPNKDGEIWVRGPQVFSGYLNRPAETKATILKDGWVRTGDIGRQDDDGFLYIVDRLKELIKYKGYQVAPATLEDILLRHDAIADVGVIGVPDEEAGELPRAFVIKKDGKETNAQELQEFVAGQVMPYMKLRGGVEFVDEIPRTPSGKIVRRALRDKAKAARSKL